MALVSYKAPRSSKRSCCALMNYEHLRHFARATRSERIHHAHFSLAPPAHVTIAPFRSQSQSAMCVGHRHGTNRIGPARAHNHTSHTAWPISERRIACRRIAMPSIRTRGSSGGGQQQQQPPPSQTRRYCIAAAIPSPPLRKCSRVHHAALLVFPLGPSRRPASRPVSLTLRSRCLSKPPGRPHSPPAPLRRARRLWAACASARASRCRGRPCRRGCCPPHTATPSAAAAPS